MHHTCSNKPYKVQLFFFFLHSYLLIMQIEKNDYYVKELIIVLRNIHMLTRSLLYGDESREKLKQNYVSVFTF